MNIQDIQKCIDELERSDTTFVNCQKLASLYIVKKHFEANEPVIREYKDVLPQYTKYCNIKRDYQLGKVGKDQVVSNTEKVCKEIKEFICTLYAHTDMPEERKELRRMVEQLVMEI